MSAFASTLFKTGCRFCRKITDGRCPKCCTVAYCSDACQLADAPEHSPSCGHDGYKMLEGMSPLSRYQQTHPDQWATIVILCTLGIDRGFIIVVHEGSDYVGIYSWETLLRCIHAGVPQGKLQYVKVSLDTAKTDQHNIIVAHERGGCYHARFALMLQPM